MRSVHNDLPLDFDRAVVKAQRLTPSIKEQKAALEHGDEFSSFMVRVTALAARAPPLPARPCSDHSPARSDHTWLKADSKYCKYKK